MIERHILADGSDRTARCAHVGVPAGPPWTQRTERGRKIGVFCEHCGEIGVFCEHCGVAWPGHKLPTPLYIRERSPGFGALPTFNQQPFQQESPR